MELFVYAIEVTLLCNHFSDIKFKNHFKNLYDITKMF